MRERPIEKTLEAARDLARQVGVVRVTDTTRLDRIGVPVFASIRPGATPMSLCVSAGKGLEPDEARVGAYMEAIELAFAEPGARSRVRIVEATGRDLQHRSGYSLLDFCPLESVTLDDDRPIPCAIAIDLDTNEEVLVPAERVLFPFDHTFYWSDTNGLASGNTLLEATVHAFSELFERDVATFHDRGGKMWRVSNDTLPPHLASLVGRVERLGFDVVIRTALNEFELPFFITIIRERGTSHGLHSGSGLHPWASIALTRAICEAFQARLTVIHGARDDLSAHFNKIAHVAEADWHRIVHDYADRRGAEPSLRFAEVPDHSASAATLEASYALMRDRARSAGLGAPLRVVLTPDDLPLQVVKLIVPRMEFATTDVRRAGPRLRRSRLLGPGDEQI